MRIALAGKMRSGKDTIANHLVESHGFKRYAFGDGIRKLCSEFFPDLVVNGKPRPLYQGVGQALRNYDEDVWIKYVIRKIETEDQNKNIVITDMRQPNEFKLLIEKGFLIVKVEASIETRIFRMEQSGDHFDVRDLFHETELFIDKFDRYDWTINNDGSLDSTLMETDRMIYSEWKREDKRGSC